MIRWHSQVEDLRLSQIGFGAIMVMGKMATEYGMPLHSSTAIPKPAAVGTASSLRNMRLSNLCPA